MGKHCRDHFMQVDKFRADRAGQVAALDGMAGQAIALAAIEGELLAVGRGRLRMSSARRQSGADQQRQKQGWYGGKRSDQRRFPGVITMISAEYRRSKA